MPPAAANVSTSLGNEADTSTLLPFNVLLSIVSVPATIKMPPPSAKRPFGAVTAAWLSLTTLFLSVRLPKARLRIPPPSASLVSPEAASARLSITTVWSSIIVPSLEMPPPPADANGQSPPPGHGIPESIATLGATLLPRMTLFLIVTVAPVEGPAARGT